MSTVLSYVSDGVGERAATGRVKRRMKREKEEEGGEVVTRVPGGLAQACLSVPLPYNRGIRIMVWVKGTSGWAVLEGNTRGKRSE